MGRFINPFTDYGFKFLFGREVEKELLIDFLKDLLSGEHVITDIQFLNNEQQPEVPRTAFSLLRNRTREVEESTIFKVRLLTILHFYDFPFTCVSHTVDIVDNPPFCFYSAER